MTTTRTRIRIGLAIGMTIVTSLGIGSSSIVARPLRPAEEARVQPAGKPVPCLSTYRIDETRVRDDQTIDFVMKGGQVFRNRLPYGCANLGFEERFAYAPVADQLCSSDVIHVLGGGGGSCGLGDFQPVTGVPR